MSAMSVFRTLGALASALFLATAPQAVSAQDGSAAPVRVPVQDRAPAGPEALVLQQRRGDRSPPLGSEIFAGQAPSVSGQIVDPGYVMKPGDSVRVTLYGLVESDEQLTIDAQGNVIVHGVGPVRVAGLTANQVPGAVEAAAQRIYSNGVQIYAAPVAAASIQVLVTGPVERPGAFSGASDDALVSYLQRAGGIDADRGSYRSIRIVRAGQTIAEADLYDFLRDGTLPRLLFRNGDAIAVGSQGSIVSVSGDVRAPYTFELAGEIGTGAEIMANARPRPEATHAAIVGSRQGQPYSAYVTLADFQNFALMDGDRVQFEADARAGNVLVRVEGAHGGPSVFTVARGSTLGDVLNQVAIDPGADMSAVHLRRESVRLTQKALINESINRLERAVLTQPANSQGAAEARAASLHLVQAYIERARQVEPLGVLALDGVDPSLVSLETGDVIVIPSRSQVITIAGEVQAPQSVIAGGSSTRTFVNLAGGFTPRADRRNVLVFRQDGVIRRGGRAEPGDRILVPTKPDSTLLPLVRDLTQTLFQVAGIWLAFDRVSD